MNWQIILQALGIVVGAVLGTSQVLGRLPKSRTTLKHDLEVLKLLDSSHPQRDVIEQHVQESINRIYKPRRDRRAQIVGNFAIHQPDNFIFGVVALFGGVLWTLYLVRGGFSWWSLLSGLLAFSGFGGIMNGLEDKGKKAG